MPSSKTCSKCKAEKAREKFGKHKLMADGLRSVCMECNREYNRKYRAANQQRTVNYGRAWRVSHPEKELKYRRRYRAGNLEKILAKNANRRARVRKLASATTPEERDAVREIYATAALVSQFMDGQPFHVDHRQPIARGGSSLADNLQHLPASMNLAKHDLSHEEALERVPGYREWTDGPPTFHQVTWRTFHKWKGSINATVELHI
jgi:hypothetical protein